MSASSLVDCVAKLVEADQQERKWLHNEIRELRVALAYLIRMNGGRVKVPETEFHRFRESDTSVLFKSTEDKENRCVIIFCDEECQ